MRAYLLQEITWGKWTVRGGILFQRHGLAIFSHVTGGVDRSACCGPALTGLRLFNADDIEGLGAYWHFVDFVLDVCCAVGLPVESRST